MGAAAISCSRTSRPIWPRWRRRRMIEPAERLPSRASTIRTLPPMALIHLKPAGAGKSSVARGVAAELGFTYLDSGAMYRCVALAGIERGADLDDGEAMGELAGGVRIGLDGGRVELDGRDVSEAIREPAVSEASSARLHPSAGPRGDGRLQQGPDRLPADHVAEGRDIGTVVSPESPLKVFLTASDEERARRRAAQTGEDPGAVLAAQRARDERDETREHSALRPAADAVELDTTGLRGRGRRPRRRPRPRAGPRVSRLPTVAVVGFPNVGKSTLVNRLAGGRETVTHAQARRHPRPQAGRVRMERAALRADRHRRHRPRRRGRAGPRHPAPGAARHGRGRRRDARRRRARRPAAGRRRGRGAAARRAPARRPGRQQGRPHRGLPSGCRVSPARARRPLRGLRGARPRHRRPARPRRRDARRDRPSRAAVDEGPRRGSRSSAAPTSASPRSSTPSSAPSGRSSPTAPARPATRSTPSSRSTGRPVVLVDTAGLRRRSKVAGTIGYYAQLRAERAGPARRRRAARLRRGRRRHRRGPADRRRHRDAGRLRDPSSPSNKWDPRLAPLARDASLGRISRTPGARVGRSCACALTWHVLGDSRAQRRQPARQGAGACRPRGRARSRPLRSTRFLADAVAKSRQPPPHRGRRLRSTTPPRSRRSRRASRFRSTTAAIIVARLGLPTSGEPPARAVFALARACRVIDFVPHSGRRR